MKLSIENIRSLYSRNDICVLIESLEQALERLHAWQTSQPSVRLHLTLLVLAPAAR